MMRPIDNNTPIDPARATSELVELACRTLDGEGSARQAAGLVRFEQAIARRTLGGGRRRVWAYGFGLATAAACVALGVMTLHPLGSTLTYAVVGGTVGDGGYVRAANGAGAEIRFSDGSNLALDPGTSTRVTDLGPNGSHVFLESGRAHVRVTHRPHTRWTVDAGPYSVRVVGTEFDIRWSGNEEMFDVRLLKGSIIVSGPLASRGLTMEAGQRLVANVKQGEIFLDRGSAAAGSPTGDNGADVGAAGQEAPSATANEVGAAETRAPAHPARVAHPKAALAAPSTALPERESLSWSKRVAAGDFQGVLADAERRGFDTALGSASVSDLKALADAARYVRRSELARRALLAERNRFPKSREGRDAAFFLGGLSEDEAGSDASKEAVTWYERYLDESPQGSFAAHALGREMVLVRKIQGVEPARALADRYLERFPNGPYASAARKLTEDR